jgi:hypothetical protein
VSHNADKSTEESVQNNRSPLDSLLQEEVFGHLKPHRGKSLLRSASSESTIPTTSRATSCKGNLYEHKEPIEAELVAKKSSSPLGRVSSSPSFTSFASAHGVSETSLLLAFEKVQQDIPPSPTQPRFLKKTRKNSISSSVSAPNLQSLSDLECPAASSLLGPRTTANHAPAEHTQKKSWAPSMFTSNASDRFTTTNPEQFLRQLIESQGLAYKTYSSLSLGESFYVPIKPENVAGYTQDLITAVHNEDLDALQHIYQHNGKTLQCCNKFGESIVHAACRKGSVVLVKFLLQHGVSLRVCDDYGRNCLHDACWAQEARPDLVKLLIEICPDLLFCKDKRGFTPLSYVQRKDWGTWCQFLEQNRDLVMLHPRDLR